jgi:hypothetical protein
MTDYPPAKLAFITNPEKQVAVLNVQTEGGELCRAVLNKRQLLNLNHEIADVLIKDFK